MKGLLLAGFIASTGSVCGKLSSADTGLSQFVAQQCEAYSWCEGAGLAVRAVCFGLMIVLNGAGVNLFVRNMHRAGTLVATVTQSAVNFTCSAIYGMVLFGEPLPLQWWLGMSCMACGIALLSTAGGGASAVKKEQ